MKIKKPDSDFTLCFATAEALIPADHPLRKLRAMVSLALDSLAAVSLKRGSVMDQRSIPPDKLFRALLLRAFYSIPSNRLLLEELGYNMLFRWFVGLSIGDEVWDHVLFTRSCERELDTEAASLFFRAIHGQAAKTGLLSNERFRVNTMLLEKWSSRAGAHWRA